MIHKRALMIQRIFPIPQLTPKWKQGTKHFIPLPSKLALHNWMEDQTPMCSPTSKISLTSDM